MIQIGKQKISSLNPAITQKKKRNYFEQQPFSVTAHQAPVTDQNIDLSGYRKPQPGEAIANVMRSIEAGTANKPAFTFNYPGNELTAPPRQNYQPIINPIRPLTAPRQDSNGKGQIVQPKLTIGRPNDKYEQEADRVAAQVVRQINRPAPMSMAQGSMVQGKEEEPGLRMKPMPAISEIEAMPKEGEILKKPILQRREAIGGGEASAELSGEINRARGGGTPLEPRLQQSMGQAMSADFSGVRVHTDERADRLNQALNARAFTTGQDLFFKKGEYQPGGREGQELIAHELTHLVQQEGRESNLLLRCQFSLNQLRQNEKMIPLVEVYELNLQKGQTIIDRLRERQQEVILEEGAPIQQHVAEYEANRIIYYAYEHVVGSGDEKDSEFIVSVTSYNPNEQNNRYINTFSFPRGVIIAETNFHGGNQEAPSYHPNNSDILWYQYMLAKKQYEEYTTQKFPLIVSQIERNNIINKETQNVMNVVFFLHGKNPTTAKPNTDSWKALLGTPNGKSSVWLIHDHYYALGEVEIGDIEIEVRNRRIYTMKISITEAAEEKQ